MTDTTSLIGQNTLEDEIARILSPSIDKNAPYAKFMIKEIAKIMSRGLPSRVDMEASGLTLAADEPKGETSKDVPRSLPSQGITGDLDPAFNLSLNDVREIINLMCDAYDKCARELDIGNKPITHHSYTVCMEAAYKAAISIIRQHEAQPKDTKSEVCIDHKPESIQTDTLNQCREAFEKWALQAEYYLARDDLDKDSYADVYTSCAWQAWRFVWDTHIPASSEITGNQYDMAEEISALRKLHAERPHVLDWRTDDGFTIPVLNVLIALADRFQKREAGKDEVINKAAFETMKILMAAPDYITLGQWKGIMRIAATQPEMNWAEEIAKLEKEGSAMWLPADLYDALDNKGLIKQLGGNIRRSVPLSKIEVQGGSND
jgi:hypothetical protein